MSKSKTIPPHRANTPASPAPVQEFDPFVSSWRRMTSAGSIRIVGALPRIHNTKAIFLWSLVTLVMLCITVPGVGLWPLAYICLVPWLVCVTCAARATVVYLASYLMGLGFYLITIHWMYPVTIPGYAGIAIFFSLQFPLVAWPVRHLSQKRGIPVAYVAPVAWTALEFLRCIGPLGFPMDLLGHSQYRVLTMIQISDLAGAYAVSFVLVMINGWIVDLLIQPIVVHRSEKTTRLPAGSLATLIVFAATIIYGLAQSSTRHLSDGPHVAMIQHDVPMYTDERGRRQPTPWEMHDSFRELIDAAIKENPDLILMPETAVQGHLNEEFLSAGPDALQEIVNRIYPKDWTVNDLRNVQRVAAETRKSLQDVSDASRATFVFGSTAVEWKPTAIPPRVDRYNSAFLLRPGAAQPAGRYDKRHLVLFGEFVPFRFTIPWLYDWLNSLTPWGKGGRHYSLSAGDGYSAFEFPSSREPGRSFRIGAPICYEEIMPYIARDFTLANGKKDIDLLTPISNDGWFLHSQQLEQHLAAGVFRAVENRIAVARSVNTGTSAMIYPNGKIHCRVMISEDQIRRLDAVETALTELQSHANAAIAAATARDKKAFGDARQRLGHFIESRLIPAYAAVGPGFRMFGQRLERFSGGLAMSSRSIQYATSQLLPQIEDDLAAVRRWRTRPDTAPAFAVDQARLDGRFTLYTRWGDVLPKVLLGLTALALLDWVQMRLRRTRSRPSAKEGSAP